MDMDDAVPDLIKRYRNHEQDAFVRLAQACSKPVWLYIRGKVHATDADDVFQKYQIALARQLRTRLKPVTSVNHLQALAFTIGKSAVVDYYRGKQNKPASEDLPVVDPAHPGLSQEETLQRGQIQAQVRRMLRQTPLTPAQRDAVILVYLMEHKKKHAAITLGISERALRERIEGAFKKFRDYLEHEERTQ